jgi:hypothetical protein
MDGQRFDELIRTVTTRTTRRGALKTIAAGLLGAAGLAGGLTAEAKVSGPNLNVCEGLDSGKIDFPDGTGPSETVCASQFEGFEDQCIIGYCAKAGSAKQASGGPEYDFESILNQLPAPCVTLTHSSGKDLSHYSLAFGPCEGPPPTTCPGQGTPKVTCCDKPGTDTGNPSICCPQVASPCGTTKSGQACCGAGSKGQACDASKGYKSADGICPTA